MSESTAPQTMTNPLFYEKLDESAAKSAGRSKKKQSPPKSILYLI